jgi:hypothetical protein
MPTSEGPDAISAKLEANRIFLVAKRLVQGKGDCLYCSVKINGVNVLVEVCALRALGARRYPDGRGGLGGGQRADCARRCQVAR